MNDINKLLRKLKRRAVKEQQFRDTPAFDIADYFRSVLKRAGYTISPDNWDKTKAAVKEALLHYPNIDDQSWKDCIDWVFSPSRYQVSFWKDVPVYSFGTVVKMFNAYKTYLCGKGSVPGGKRRVRYGKLSHGK